MKSKKLVAIFSAIMVSLSSFSSLTMAMESDNLIPQLISSVNLDLYTTCPYNEKNLIEAAHYGTNNWNESTIRSREALMSWVDRDLRNTEFHTDYIPYYEKLEYINRKSLYAPSWGTYQLALLRVGFGNCINKCCSCFKRNRNNVQQPVTMSFDNQFDKVIDSIIINYDRIPTPEIKDSFHFRRDIANAFIKYRLEQSLRLGGCIRLQPLDFLPGKRYGFTYLKRSNQSFVVNHSWEDDGREVDYSDYNKYLHFPSNKNTAFKDLEVWEIIPNIDDPSYYTSRQKPGYLPDPAVCLTYKDVCDILNGEASPETMDKVKTLNKYKLSEFFSEDQLNLLA